MTAGDIYTVAGSATGARASSGDGGPATAALMSYADRHLRRPGRRPVHHRHRTAAPLREVVSATATATVPRPRPDHRAPLPYPGGITVTQPGGAQVTFYAQAAGACAAPTSAAGSGSTAPCPQDTGATLTYNSGTAPTPSSPSPGHQPTPTLRPGSSPARPTPPANTLTITYGHARPPGTGTLPGHAAAGARPSPPPPAAPWSSATDAVRPGHLRHRPDGPHLDLRLHRPAT